MAVRRIAFAALVFLAYVFLHAPITAALDHLVKRWDPEERFDLAPGAAELVGALLEDLLRWNFWHEAELRRGPPYSAERRP